MITFSMAAPAKADAVEKAAHFRIPYLSQDKTGRASRPICYFHVVTPGGLQLDQVESARAEGKTKSFSFRQYCLLSTIDELSFPDISSWCNISVAP